MSYWGLNQWQPQNYFDHYVQDKLFTDGKLDSEKVEKYGSLFGLRIDDFKGDEKQSTVSQFIFNKQKDAFGGIDPTSQPKESTKDNGIYDENTQRRLSLVA